MPYNNHLQHCGPGKLTTYGYGGRHVAYYRDSAIWLTDLGVSLGKFITVLLNLSTVNFFITSPAKSSIANHYCHREKCIKDSLQCGQLVVNQTVLCGFRWLPSKAGHSLTLSNNVTTDYCKVRRFISGLRQSWLDHRYSLALPPVVLF